MRAADNRQDAGIVMFGKHDDVSVDLRREAIGQGNRRRGNAGSIACTATGRPAANLPSDVLRIERHAQATLPATPS